MAGAETVRSVQGWKNPNVGVYPRCCLLQGGALLASEHGAKPNSPRRADERTGEVLTLADRQRLEAVSKLALNPSSSWWSGGQRYRAYGAYGEHKTDHAKLTLLARPAAIEVDPGQAQHHLFD